MASDIIALEEHYADAELAAHFSGLDAAKVPHVRERLDDDGPLRLKEMDEAGITLQVISHIAPAAQNLDAAIAVPLARRVNDRLAAMVRRHPERLAGFAALPTAEPLAAADELERCVRDLRFKGAMLHGRSQGVWLDDRRFWPIYHRAAALGVPLYMHPSNPSQEIVHDSYESYAKQYPAFVRAGWGYTVETATQAIRLVLSGLFRENPDLTIVLGHLGETLPFLLARIDDTISRNAKQDASFREQFCRHFFITTSGNFSTPALTCSIMELGVDRIMFSVDWPYDSNSRGTAWMRDAPLSDADKDKILSGNARRLLRLDK